MTKMACFLGFSFFGLLSGLSNNEYLIFKRVKKIYITSFEIMDVYHLQRSFMGYCDYFHKVLKVFFCSQPAIQYDEISSFS